MSRDTGSLIVFSVWEGSALMGSGKGCDVCLQNSGKLGLSSA